MDDSPIHFFNVLKELEHSLRAGFYKRFEAPVLEDRVKIRSVISIVSSLPETMGSKFYGILVD